MTDETMDPVQQMVLDQLQRLDTRMERFESVQARMAASLSAIEARQKRDEEADAETKQRIAKLEDTRANLATHADVEALKRVAWIALGIVMVLGIIVNNFLGPIVVNAMQDR